MAAHDRLDGFGGFIGVVKGNGGDIMVKDVGFDNAVEELAANETEFAIDGCGGATSVSPGVGLVVWE